MFGVLKLLKPVGWTSRDVVNRVERIIRPVKAGHAGTLDPLASGVLVVCVGEATRLIEYVQRQPKEYVAIFQLGRRSASDDLETPVEVLDDAPIPTLEQIEAALPQFIGVVQQRPPAYSAVKLGGRRAYRLARKGTKLDLPPRPVEVHQLAIGRYEYPELNLIIRCGSGTYVRSLGRDVAEELGTAAVMSDLVRTAIGPFRLEQGLAAKALDEASLREHLLPATAAVGDLPRVVLSAERAAHVARGGLVATEELGTPNVDAIGEWAAVNHQGRLIAILKPARPGLLKPSPNFSQPE
jgi:tRNA pseudouridine55 synthase